MSQQLNFFQIYMYSIFKKLQELWKQRKPLTKLCNNLLTGWIQSHANSSRHKNSCPKILETELIWPGDMAPEYGNVFWTRWHAVTDTMVSIMVLFLVNNYKVLYILYWLIDKQSPMLWLMLCLFLGSYHPYWLPAFHSCIICRLLQFSHIANVS